MEGDEAEIAAAEGTASPSEPAKPSSLATGGGGVQQKKKDDDSSSDYNGSNAAEELEESSEDDDKSKVSMMVDLLFNAIVPLVNA